ncbi:MAG: DUF5131 family protein [Thermoplasmata archaeon]|nr:DUF5131 family protein [Thermoplasmata archaeon]
MSTKIEWCDETWNPVTGCSPISEGCDHCYAKRMAQRFKGRFGYPDDDPFRPGTMHDDKIHEPAHLRKAQKIFAVSMGDMFHEAVEWNHLFSIWQMMGMVDRHTFMVLTKRPANAKYHLTGELGFHLQRQDWCRTWPLPNVWVGVSAENQDRFDDRWPLLARIPAAVRFVSLEPMLDFIDIQHATHCDSCGYTPRDMAIQGDHHLCKAPTPVLDWVIAGPERGPGARAVDPDAFKYIKMMSTDEGVPFFLKGLSIDGKTYQEFPERREL